MRIRLVVVMALALLLSGCVPLIVWLSRAVPLPQPSEGPRVTLPTATFTASALLADAACAPAAELPADIVRLIEEILQAEAACLDLGHGSDPIAVFEVEGLRALDIWELLESVLPDAGWWPVIVGDGPSLDLLIDAASHSNVSVREVYRAADDIDYAKWITERTQLIVGDGSLPETDEVFELSERDAHYLTNQDALTGDFLPRVYMLLVPAEESPDVVAQVLFGCWNDNPCPAEHLAVLRHWHEVYEADIVSIGDQLEVRVGRPPTDWESAMQLAREQYVYDYDIVDQGVGTINRLAQEIGRAGSWYFWWD